MSTGPAKPRSESASCYLIIEPRHDYSGKLSDIRVDRVTTTRPTKLSPRYVAIKLNIVMAASLFEQFLPEATITVNDTRDLIAPVISVEQPDAAADELID